MWLFKTGARAYLWECYTSHFELIAFPAFILISSRLVYIFFSFIGCHEAFVFSYVSFCCSLINTELKVIIKFLLSYIISKSDQVSQIS